MARTHGTYGQWTTTGGTHGQRTTGGTHGQRTTGGTHGQWTTGGLGEEALAHTHVMNHSQTVSRT